MEDSEALFLKPLSFGNHRTLFSRTSTGDPIDWLQSNLNTDAYTYYFNS